jgi:hypothetical protein
VLRRASEKEIIILRTPFTTFDACVALSNIKQ